jgi:acyl CoA:acetate/3-ketoacid CoA transferase beta subunit
LGVFDVMKDGLHAVELAPDVTQEEVRTKTGCPVKFAQTAVAA